MEDALRVDHPDWHLARMRRYIDDRMRRVGTDWHAAVAYLDGRSVGSARWFVHRSLHAVEFMGAETLVDYRNRGVYSPLVAFRVDHAAKEGCVAAGIIADSRTSAPILLKRGFHDLGGATFYLWPQSHLKR